MNSDIDKVNYLDYESCCHVLVANVGGEYVLDAGTASREPHGPLHELRAKITNLMQSQDLRVASDTASDVLRALDAQGPRQRHAEWAEKPG
jgi:hypothetical protein